MNTVPVRLHRPAAPVPVVVRVSGSGTFGGGGEYCGNTNPDYVGVVLQAINPLYKEKVTELKGKGA